jgi:hypothetical protein
MTLPDNIALLHTGEETLRVEALRRIAEMPDMLAHLKMVESGMDVVHSLLPSTAVQDESQLALGNLGIRVFNAVAVALKLLLSGYYQASALQLRDVLETTFLLDYFSTDVALIAQWRSMPEADRKRVFGPAKIRIALDNRDGFTESKRAKAYDLLCGLAGHATPEGAIMLVPDRNCTTVHCGPFLEETALAALLSECASLATQAAIVFCVVIKDENLDQTQSRITFMEAQGKWFKRFFDREPDNARIDELKALLALARREQRSSGVSDL